MGINVIEDDEAEDDGEQKGRPRWSKPRRAAKLPSLRPRPKSSTAPTTRCACICARWGRSSLLSREGEIAIAKRIEAGRNTMIAGLCESPLTFQAITIWRDELLDEDILLRDVIDLDATFGTVHGRR
jgi:RNA polymerase primary sigma factor